MTAGDRQLLIKLAATAVVGYVLWHVSKPVRDTLNSAKNGLDATGEYLGEKLADVTQALNGSHDIQFTKAGFVLDERYVGGDGKIDEWWRKTMTDAHPDNAVLFRKITDRSGRLLPEYHHLIEKLVDDSTI